eukprot:598144-Hanusia_phi.AAC.1
MEWLVYGRLFQRKLRASLGRNRMMEMLMKMVHDIASGCGFSTSLTTLNCYLFVCARAIRPRQGSMKSKGAIVEGEASNV